MAPKIPTTPDERAEELLQTYLSPLQQQMRRIHSWFYLYDKKGRIWVLGDGWRAFRCDEMGKPHIEHHATPAHPCHIAIHVGLGYLPIADRIIGQLLVLTTDPHYLIKEACKYDVALWARPDLERLCRQYSKRWLKEGKVPAAPAVPAKAEQQAWPSHGGLWGVPHWSVDGRL